MKRMWAPEELNELAAAAADAEILAKVNIKYALDSSDRPTWTIGNLTITKFESYTTVDSTSSLLFNNTVRFNGSIRDANNLEGSVKKIYCHPVMAYGSGKNRIMALIFNNDSTQYGTESLFNLLVNDANIRLSINGIMDGKSVIYMTKVNDTTIQVVYVDLNQTNGISTMQYTLEQFQSAFDNGLIDSVHPIN